MILLVVVQTTLYLSLLGGQTYFGCDIRGANFFRSGFREDCTFVARSYAKRTILALK